MTDNQLLYASKEAIDAEQRELELRARLLEEKRKRLEQTNELKMPKELMDNLETQKAKLAWEEAQGKSSASQLSSVGLILGIGAVIIGAIIMAVALTGGISGGSRTCITSYSAPYAACSDCPDSNGRCGGDNTCKSTTINGRGPYNCYKVDGSGNCSACK